jgi:hypothetical protein
LLNKLQMSLWPFSLKRRILMTLRAAFNVRAFIALTLGLATPSLASHQTGYVTLIGGDGRNPFVFSVSGIRTSVPACATDTVWVVPNSNSANAQGLVWMAPTLQVAI